jgi:hypothetical protein
MKFLAVAVGLVVVGIQPADALVIPTSFTSSQSTTHLKVMTTLPDMSHAASCSITELARSLISQSTFLMSDAWSNPLSEAAKTFVQTGVGTLVGAIVALLLAIPLLAGVALLSALKFIEMEIENSPEAQKKLDELEDYVSSLLFQNETSTTYPKQVKLDVSFLKYTSLAEIWKEVVSDDFAMDVEMKEGGIVKTPFGTFTLEELELTSYRDKMEEK